MVAPTQTGLNQKLANRITAQVIPVVLAGIVVYATWVMIKLVSVDHFLRASTPVHKPRKGAGIAVLVVYSLLLLLMSTTYLRLICTIIFNPGYVPRGPQWYDQREKRARQSGKVRRGEKSGGFVANSTGGNDGPPGFRYDDGPLGPGVPASRPLSTDDASPELRNFYGKEVFTCEGNGKPIWCPYCSNFKPDRAHHCREIGRCVRKMDHFCPWVGGVVSETSFKFFAQFTAWTAIYCLFTLIVTGIVISEVKKENRLNAHYIITISLAALFGLFGIGMTGSSLQFAVLNTTTIENLSRHSKVWLLAVHLPRTVTSSTAAGLPTVTYPLVTAAPSAQSPNPARTFVILRSRPGENPWDRGPLENFKSVFGERWYDWILPLKHSPCVNHDGSESQFALGPAVERMRIEAGLSTPPVAGLEPRVERRKRKRSRRDRGSISRRSRTGADGSLGQREMHHGSNYAGNEFSIALNDTHSITK